MQAYVKRQINFKQYINLDIKIQNDLQLWLAC